MTKDSTTTPTTPRRGPGNPTGAGGFGDHPEHRNPGGWDPKHSISHQYKRLLAMPEKEFNDFKPETMAQKVAMQRLKNAILSSGLLDTREITDRTEGKAPQSIDMTSLGEKVQGASITFVDSPPVED